MIKSMQMMKEREFVVPEIKLKNESGTDEPHGKERPEDGSIILSPRRFRRHVNDLTAHLGPPLVITNYQCIVLRGKMSSFRKVEKITGPQMIAPKVPKSFCRP